MADLGDGDGVDGFVELAVPAAVEAVTYNSSGTGFQRRGAVGHRELGFGGVTGGVSHSGEDLGCDQGADSVNVGEGRS